MKIKDTFLLLLNAKSQLQINCSCKSIASLHRKRAKVKDTAHQNNVFSEVYFSVLRSLLYLSNIFGVTPIKWDPVNGRLFVSTNKHLHWKCYAVYSVIIEHILFTAVQAAYSYHLGTMLDVGQLLLAFSFQLLSALSIWLLIMSPEDVVIAVNGLILYLKSYYGMTTRNS